MCPRQSREMGTDAVGQSHWHIEIHSPVIPKENFQKSTDLGSHANTFLETSIKTFPKEPIHVVNNKQVTKVNYYCVIELGPSTQQPEIHRTLNQSKPFQYTIRHITNPFNAFLFLFQ